jgi:serine/threonine-protein kinase
MAEPEVCPNCRSELPVSAPWGLCPTCLLREALSADGPVPGEGATATFTPGSQAQADQATRVAAVPAPCPGPGRFKIEVVSGPHRGIRLDFDQRASLLVGRGDDTGLQLVDDPFFSRHHLRLEIDPPSCRLRDLQSSNGTWVNGQRVMDCFLSDGDVISGGQTRIVYSRVIEPTSTRGVGAVRPSPAVEHKALTTTPEGPETLPQWAGVSPLLRPPGYEILKTIGEHGMGIVYLARRRATGQEVALKVILPESAASPTAQSRFLREVSVLSRLDHPRIVRFHEIGQAQGQFYFAMEYVATIDLMALLGNLELAGRVSLACGLVCQALEGLEYAHSLGFVHRDVKPSNLLVSRQGSKVWAKVADFGLAKSFEQAGFSALTREDQAVGTIAFMAPEQALAARFARPSVDIYAAGATLYYLLSGKVPHEFDEGRDRLVVIREDEPVPLERRCAGLPAGLAEVVHRALAKEPPGRFPTARALHRALRPFTRGPAAGLEADVQDFDRA